MTETAFKKKLIPLLKAIPKSWWTKVNQVSKRGDPDFLGCVNGCFVALELKRDSKQKPTALQERSFRKISEAYGVVYLVTPENHTNVLDILHFIAGQKSYSLQE